MLNTKPIKNKNQNIFESRIPNLSSDTKMTNGSDKVVILESSKQKRLEEMVKQANIDNEQNNINKDFEDKQGKSDKQMGGVINDPHNNVYIQNPVLNREFTYDRYKDSNLNVSNLINGGKMFISNVDRKMENDIVIGNQINPHNQINNFLFKEIVEIKWNDIDNSYILTNKNTNEIECKIYNESILKYIINNETNDVGIKKYIFIISWNSQTESFEFNFIESVFTSNFDMMIKLQNFIYDTLINFDNLDISDTYNYKEIILMFYFQMVIYLFNNYEKYLIYNDTNKISRVCSSIVYRFSSLILKNILKIKTNIDENNKILNDLMIFRSDIFSQINFIDNKLEQFEQINKQNNTLILTETEEIEETDDTNSTNSTNSTKSTKSKSSKQYNIVNRRKINKSTDYETDNSIYKSNASISNLGYINKDGKKIKKIKDLFTEELQINTNKSDNDNDNDDENNNDNNNSSDNSYDSEKNGYFEINDAFADFEKYKKNHIEKNNKHNIKNLLKLAEPNGVKKNLPIENSIQSNIKSYTTNSKDQSFNPNSAIKNSKIFEIPI